MLQIIICQLFKNFRAKVKRDKKNDLWIGATCGLQINIQGNTDFV